ncbi:MAG TPA: glycoside hydrolase family 36 N-terminal domain-containing protein, partial [Pseudonocardia sp.]
MTEWELPTARSVYVVAETDVGLVLRHWGSPGQRRAFAPAARTPFEAPTDKVPLEFAAAGTRHAQFAELLVQGSDGVDGALLRLVPESVTVTDDGRDAALTALLRDPDAGIEVALHVRTSRAHDVVERWARVRSLRTAGDLHLTRAFGAAWNVPVGPGARVAELVGTWSREFTPAGVDLPAGQLSLGSRQGITSHLYSPVVALRARDSGDDCEAYGVALAWSGSWRMVVDAVPFRDVVRVSGGADDETAVITLAPGEEFETPHLLGAWSSGGL